MQVSLCLGTQFNCIFLLSTLQHDNFTSWTVDVDECSFASSSFLHEFACSACRRASKADAVLLFCWFFLGYPLTFPHSCVFNCQFFFFLIASSIRRNWRIVEDAFAHEVMVGEIVHFETEKVCLVSYKRLSCRISRMKRAHQYLPIWTQRCVCMLVHVVVCAVHNLRKFQ